jgi:hypothetical protein
LGANHLKRLLDSYRLATERPPPPGLVLIHGAPPRQFRAWWAKPAAEFVLCAWRPDLGEHYRVHRPGPPVRRRWRRASRRPP